MNIQVRKSIENPEIETQTAIMGIIGRDTAQIDAAISKAAEVIVNAGHSVLGVVQERGKKSADCACREMRLRDLANGKITIISERRGKQARGCHLDRAALLEHAKRFEARILDMPDLVTINRFGRAECEGSGFRSAIELAVTLNIPVLVGVSKSYLDGWNKFHGGMASSISPEIASIVQWFESINA